MVILRDSPASGRLEMEEGGQVVFADYRLDRDRLIVDHVEAPPVLRGTGASGRFMQALAAWARSKDLKITPLCGYAASWLRRSPDHRDLIG
jgi:predicted GNAT family acetyltransferase